MKKEKVSLENQEIEAVATLYNSILKETGHGVAFEVNSNFSECVVELDLYRKEYKNLFESFYNKEKGVFDKNGDFLRLEDGKDLIPGEKLDYFIDPNRSLEFNEAILKLKEVKKELNLYIIPVSKIKELMNNGKLEGVNFSLLFHKKLIK